MQWQHRVWSVRLGTMAAGLVLSWSLMAQSVPSRPLGIPVYHPMVLNPAYTGSKDYTNISLTSRIYSIPDNQILQVHQRLTRPGGSFSPVGVGGFLFQEQKERSWNLGVAGSAAYHFPVDRAGLHNLAAGATLKAILNVPKGADDAAGDSLTSSFNPNVDLGIYYYGPAAFAGISVTTLFSGKKDADSEGLSDDEIPREFHFYGGVKFLLSRNNAIVLEPSLLFSLSDSAMPEAGRQLVPYLKLYLQNFYVGTYVKNLETFALFFQYQFPKFNAGVLLEFPRVGFLNDENIIFEISLGVNLNRRDLRFTQFRHW